MKIKSGFTMAELLITMAIIGIVTVFGLKTVLHNDKVVKYAYSNIYHTLDKALYNALYATNLKNPFLSKDSGTTRLCNMLTYYINTVSKSCDTAAVTSITADTLKNPHFVAMNNVRFYISKRFPDSDTAEHYFYIVFADLNGDKKPNSMTYNPPKEEPDVFAFAALDVGRVCPLGPPEIDPKFMQTRITYIDPDSDVAAFSKAPKPYYISKAEAWGYYLSSNKISDAFYIEANPLTYNGYVKDIIKNNNSSFHSSIYGFLGGSSLSAPASVTLMSKKVSEKGYGCKKSSDIECDVIIEKYLY